MAVAPRPRCGRVATTLLVIVAAMLSSCMSRSEDFGDWESRFYWGAHVAVESPGGDYSAAVQRLESATGTSMSAARTYRRWEDPFPTATEVSLKSGQRLDVMSIKPIRADGSRIAWAEIGRATAGTQLYGEMTTWARRIKKFGRPIYVTLHHEPETTDDKASGDSADYIKAWKRFAEIIRESGGPNVRLMWIMTDRSFTLTNDDWQFAGNWYPGDDVVDAIGVDAFNWYTCRGRNEGWKSARELIEPARLFAASHPTTEFWVTELGSIEDPSDPGRRAAWLAELATLPRSAGWDQLHGVLYFNDVHGPQFPACDWRLSNGPAAAAFGRLDAIPAEPPTTVTSTSPTTT